MRTPDRPPGRARSGCRRVPPASAERPAPRRARRPAGLHSRVFLEDERAMQPGHVLPPHLGRLADRLDRVRLLLRGRAVPLHDLVPALPVHFVGLDVDREELHLVVGESVVGLERREVALVDPGHLRLQADQQARRGDVEGLTSHLVAPRGQPPRARKLSCGLHLGPAQSARLAEADQEIHVLGAGLLLDDVLEQEVARVRVGAAAVDGRAPAGELRDVLVVLANPGAELPASQLPVYPLLGEGIHATVAGVDGLLELGPERAHGGHTAPPWWWVDRTPRLAGRSGPSGPASGHRDTCGARCGRADACWPASPPRAARRWWLPSCRWRACPPGCPRASERSTAGS